MPRGSAAGEASPAGGRPTETGIRAELAAAFPGTAMQVVTRPAANAYGPYGLAVGRAAGAPAASTLGSGSPPPPISTRPPGDPARCPCGSGSAATTSPSRRWPPRSRRSRSCRATRERPSRARRRRGPSPRRGPAPRAGFRPRRGSRPGRPGRGRRDRPAAGPALPGRRRGAGRRARAPGRGSGRAAAGLDRRTALHPGRGERRRPATRGAPRPGRPDRDPPVRIA